MSGRNFGRRGDGGRAAGAPVAALLSPAAPLRAVRRYRGGRGAGSLAPSAVRSRQFGAAVMTDGARHLRTACLTGNAKSFGPDEDNEKPYTFQQDDLFSQGFPVFEEIRRQGKLCDVTLKVRIPTRLTSALLPPSQQRATRKKKKKKQSFVELIVAICSLFARSCEIYFFFFFNYFVHYKNVSEFYRCDREFSYVYSFHSIRFDCVRQKKIFKNK